MSAGKQVAKSRAHKNDTLRTGTIVETRGAGKKSASSRKEDTKRTGTIVETRSAGKMRRK